VARPTAGFARPASGLKYLARMPDALVPAGGLLGSPNLLGGSYSPTGHGLSAATPPWLWPGSGDPGGWALPSPTAGLVGCPVSGVGGHTLFKVALQG